MTGPVTFEQLFAFLGLFAAAGGVVAGFLAWVFRIVASLRRAYMADRDVLQVQIEKCEKDVADYKVHAAEHFASKIGVSTQISRLEDAVQGVSDKVDASSDRITGRIDRLLEMQANPPAAPRRRAAT